MLKTELCTLLNIEYPLLQGGMAWISDADLAAAVSNAGGLGIMAAGTAPPDFILSEIRKIKTLTDKPFGVNVMLMSSFADEIAHMLAEEKVPVVVTGAGNPAKYMPLWIQCGMKVIPVVPSVALAKMMERYGASAVIAEGCESGGHIGELTTMTLIPQVCDAVSLPVIAAGGIGDGRGLLAALMLGACGVQVGTRFLVAKECNVHQNYKDMVLKAKDISTIATGKRLGHPVRVIKNSFALEFLKKEYDSSITNEELEMFGAGSLKLAAVDGDTTKGSFMAGQIAGMVKQEQSAKEIIEDIFCHAKEVFKSTMMF